MVGATVKGVFQIFCSTLHRRAQLCYTTLMSFKLDRSSLDFSKSKVLDKFLEVLDRRGVMFLLACITVIICSVILKDSFKYRYKFHDRFGMILDTSTGEWAPPCDNNRMCILTTIEKANQLLEARRQDSLPSIEDLNRQQRILDELNGSR